MPTTRTDHRHVAPRWRLDGFDPPVAAAMSETSRDAMNRETASRRRRGPPSAAPR